MSLELKIDSGKIKRNGRLYLVFTLVFAVVAYFYYYSGVKYYSDISKSVKEIEGIKNDINILESKITSLRAIKESTVSDINALNVAFQSEDPLLFMYAQLKALASDAGVVIEGVAFSSGAAKTDISASVIAFSVRGVKENVYNFITGLTTTAPLTGLRGMSFSDYVKSGESIDIKMSIDVYYSPLPKTLPDTQKTVNVLTGEEQDIYKKLVELKVLSKTDFLPQLPDENIEDPFSRGVNGNVGEKE